MLGTVVHLPKRFCKSVKTCDIRKLEYTRHRKKPPGGSRFLNDKQFLYELIAWYSTFTAINIQVLSLINKFKTKISGTT